MSEFHANSLFRGLDAGQARAILPLAEPFAFASGHRLVRQNDAARGAWLIGSGHAEVRVTLPAGGERVVASLGAGGTFGESALFESGVCNASIYAVSAVEGWFLPGDAFRALVMGRHPAALTIQRNITVTLIERLSALNSELARQKSPEDRPASTLPASDPLAQVPRGGAGAFDFAPFLALLSFFQGFTTKEIESVVAGCAALDVQRGQWIFAAGQPAQACYLVVRGALEATRSIGNGQAALERRIAVLPPGGLAGYLSILAEKPLHGAHARAREDSLLLEFPAAKFLAHYRGETSAEVKFQHAIHRTLLTSLARSNSQLARLVTQAALGEVRSAAVALQS